MYARKDDYVNVLCMGARYIGSGLAARMAVKWLEQPFEGGRHRRRINKVISIEKRFHRK
jgi:ribose 5-phosphate isomerase B